MPNSMRHSTSCSANSMLKPRSLWSRSLARLPKRRHRKRRQRKLQKRSLLVADIYEWVRPGRSTQDEVQKMKSIMAVFMAAVLCLASVGCGTGTASNLVTALNAVSGCSFGCSRSYGITAEFPWANLIRQSQIRYRFTQRTLAPAVNTSLAELNTQ